MLLMRLLILLRLTHGMCLTNGSQVPRLRLRDAQSSDRRGGCGVPSARLSKLIRFNTHTNLLRALGTQPPVLVSTAKENEELLSCCAHRICHDSDSDSLSPSSFLSFSFLLSHSNQLAGSVVFSEMEHAKKAEDPMADVCPELSNHEVGNGGRQQLATMPLCVFADCSPLPPAALPLHRSSRSGA